VADTLCGVCAPWTCRHVSGIGTAGLANLKNLPAAYEGLLAALSAVKSFMMELGKGAVVRRHAAAAKKTGPDADMQGLRSCADAAILIKDRCVAGKDSVLRRAGGGCTVEELDATCPWAALLEFPTGDKACDAWPEDPAAESPAVGLRCSMADSVLQRSPPTQAQADAAEVLVLDEGGDEDDDGLGDEEAADEEACEPGGGAGADEGACEPVGGESALVQAVRAAAAGGGGSVDALE
jgi:hypothetical protein